MHCRENGLHSGLPFCDLLLELLQLVNNLLQLEPDALHRHSAVHQKCPRPFTATDLRYDFFNLSPRRNPLAPDNEGNAAEGDAIRIMTNQVTAFVFSSRYFSQQSGCQRVSQCEITVVILVRPSGAGCEVHTLRRRFNAVGSAVLSGYAQVTALARKDCADDSARYSTARPTAILALLFAEPIAKAAHGFNHIASFAEFFAQSADVRVHSPGVDHAFVAPDVIEQFVAILHPASALD